MVNASSFLTFLTESPNNISLASINHSLLRMYGLSRAERQDVLKEKGKRLVELAKQCTNRKEFEEETGFTERSARIYLQKARLLHEYDEGSREEFSRLFVMDEVNSRSQNLG